MFLIFWKLVYFDTVLLKFYPIFKAPLYAHFFSKKTCLTTQEDLYLFLATIAVADLKQIDYQIFLQQRWIHLGSAENCNLVSVTMVSHVQILTQQGKENTFKEGKRKLRGL